MPLDPNIPLAVKPPVPIKSPFDHAAEATLQRSNEQTVRLNELTIAGKSDELQQQRAARQVLADAKGDLSPATLARMRAVAPGLAVEFEKQLGVLRKDTATASQTELENELKNLGLGLGMLAAVPDGDQEAYTHVRGLVLRRVPDLEAALPPQYNREALANVQRAGTTAQARIELNQKALEGALKGDFRYYAGLLAAEDDPAERAEIRAGFLALGAPAGVLDAMEVNPGAASMTENERQQAADRQADNARMAEAAAETARHNRASEATARQNAASAATRARAAAQTAAAGSATGSAGDMAPEYATALDRAIMNIPAVRRPAIVGLANRLAKAGDVDQLKEVIRQAAIETENVDDKRQIAGRFNAAAAVRDIRAGLRELQAKGVNTNILRGSVEDAARRLGTSTDPDLVTISTRVLDAYVEYRRSLTGVAFSERESADYEKLFPNYRNTLPVNEAILAGLERGFATRDREYWTRVLGAKGAQLVGAIPSETTTAPPPPGAGAAAFTVTHSGKVYTFKTQADLDTFKRAAGIK